MKVPGRFLAFTLALAVGDAASGSQSSTQRFAVQGRIIECSADDDPSLNVNERASTSPGAKPIVGARVTLAFQGSRSWSTRTDAEGRFRIQISSIVEPATFSITVSHPERYGLKVPGLKLGSGERDFRSGENVVEIALPPLSESCRPKNRKAAR